MNDILCFLVDQGAAKLQEVEVEGPKTIAAWPPCASNFLNKGPIAVCLVKSLAALIRYVFLSQKYPYTLIMP